MVEIISIEPSLVPPQDPVVWTPVKDDLPTADVFATFRRVYGGPAPAPPAPPQPQPTVPRPIGDPPLPDVIVPPRPGDPINPEGPKDRPEDWDPNRRTDEPWQLI